MSQQQKGRRTRRITHTTQRSQHLTTSPFVYTSCTVANERHPERNEDSLLVDTRTGLVGVFDGVGGSAAGEIASQTAARAIQQGWTRVLKRYQKKRTAQMMLHHCENLDLHKTLQDLILESDELVRTDGAQRAGTEDLATTIALGILCKNSTTNRYVLVYAHVGDSRIYLLREQEQLQRLTNDDGLLAKLVDNQIVNETEARRIDQAMYSDQLSDVEFNYFRHRGGITQALGGPLPPTIHTDQITLQPGDRVLFCTDGIHDNLTDEEIEATLRNTPRTTIARKLVDLSRQRSQQDRSTTIRAKPDDLSAVVVTYRFY